MTNVDYTLTKTNIIRGLECRKKLWFDFHNPTQNKDEYLLNAGRRFGKIIRNNYRHGQVLDLSEIFNIDIAIERTKEAINSGDIDVIYEGAFIHADTLVRTDVLIRKKNSWKLLEAKGSKERKDEHIPDIAIQSFIVKSCGVNLTSIKLILIDPEFIYKGNEDYQKLINDKEDITEEVFLEEKEVINHINNLKSFADKKISCPDISMGKHCDEPHTCKYKDRCETSLPKSTITRCSILPYFGGNLKKYCDNNEIENLLDIPSKELKNAKHKIIQDCHKTNKPWFNKELKSTLKEFEWPFYFMDFETVQQKVPIIKETKPFDPLPFQWSLHKWESKDTEILLNDGSFFIDFSSQDIERKFVEKLLEDADLKGTIFAHHASTEITALEKLKKKESCKDLADKIDKLINRVRDTEKLVKENFYHPAMNGKYGLKKIIKAIPDSINYEEDAIGGGMAAQLAWLVCTDPKTLEEEKKKQKNLLKNYCAKDTINLYYLVKYLIEKTNEK